MVFFVQDRDTHEKYVCAPKEFTDVAGRQDPLNCPSHCRQYRQIPFNELDKFNLAYVNGMLVMKNESTHPNVKVCQHNLLSHNNDMIPN